MFAVLPMDLKRAMAINVRRERHARDWSQEELADRARLSARYLGSIERAAVSASVTVLGRLAQALRIDPCELIRSPHRRWLLANLAADFSALHFGLGASCRRIKANSSPISASVRTNRASRALALRHSENPSSTTWM